MGATHRPMVEHHDQTKGLHIGVDATCWGNTRGYGRHARALLGALLRIDSGHRYTFFVDVPDEMDSMPVGADVRHVSSSHAAAVAASVDGHRSLADMWRMSRALSTAGVDVLLFPTVYTYVPVMGRAKKIVFIHDIIAERYPELTLPSRRARLFWAAKVGLGRRQAEAIVTVSNYSREAISRHFGISLERIWVVGEASDPTFHLLDAPRLGPRLTDAGVKADRPLIVYVGGFGPHKNLHRLVSAYADLSSHPSLQDALLVMVGNYQEVFYSTYDALREQIHVLGLDDRVVFTGYLPDEDLVALLNLATVLVLPSLMEGFGLPAVEAAACGCPVIATEQSPLPELLGEGGLYVDPLDQGALEQALERVLSSSDLRHHMRQAGLEASARLSWEAAAQQMMRVMEEVAAR